MCGICGFTGQASEGILDAMLASLHHRGPDDEGRFISPKASLGVRRLAVIDVAHGHQPSLTEDEMVVAALNGEIYNHRRLRRMLATRGHQFRSRADTEIIPHLYEEFGPAFVTLLRGMFAIAVWDRRKEKLILVRDRTGEKPLFYAALRDGRVSFASELRSLLTHLGSKATVDLGCIPAYLTLGYVPGPRTIVSEVRRLPAGHVLSWQNGRTELNSYWEPLPSARQYGISRAGARDQLRGLLEDAVRSQLEADVPIGALLSGGIDSAAIVAMMASVGGSTPKTFTVGFAERGFDERDAAAVVARHVGTDHMEIVVEQPDEAELHTLVSALDEPIGDQAALPTLLIAREARRHVTVVLTGEGSDELFAGYPRYGWFDLATRIDRSPASPRSAIVRTLRAFGREARGKQIELMLSAQAWLDRYVQWIGIFPARDVADVLRHEVLAEAATLDTIPYLASLADQWGNVSAVERTMLLDLRTWLVDSILVKADRMSMAVSLETRAPYLDHRVVEFATSLPMEMRLNVRSTKWLLREAVADLLPAETVRRPKHAFRVPVEAWLAARLTPVLRELLLGSDACSAEFLRPGVVERLLSRSDRDTGRQLWALGILELWLRNLKAVA